MRNGSSCPIQTGLLLIFPQQTSCYIATNLKSRLWDEIKDLEGDDTKTHVYSSFPLQQIACTRRKQ